MDWNGELYFGFSLDWEYKNTHGTISMSGYVDGAMHKYQYKMKTRPHNAPHKWERKYYGAKTQWESNNSNIPILQPEDIKYTQNVVGNSDGPTILLVLITLSATQPKEPEDTNK